LRNLNSINDSLENKSLTKKTSTSAQSINKENLLSTSLIENKRDVRISTNNMYLNNTPEIIITDENSIIQIEKTLDDEVKFLGNDKNLTQLYFRRWIILFIFASISLLSAFNWIEYNIIQDVTIKFYNASLPEGEVEQNDAVNWFSMVYMLCYIPLVFPSMFLLDKKGLRLSCVLGALLTTIGSIIKCAAVDPNLFLVAMAGQTICASNS
jgi:hypothetical protein